MPLYTEITTLDIGSAPPAAVPSPRGVGCVASRGGYQSAAVHRLNRDWLPAHLAADAAIELGWDMLTRRARDLVRNEPWAAQSRQRITQNVIGDEGYRAEADVEIDGEPDEDTNTEIDEWCERWAEEADAEGKLHLIEMQDLAMGEAVEVGECFLVETQLPDPGRVIPLAYQLIEAEQLCRELDWPAQGSRLPVSEAIAAGNIVRRGIEFDAYRRPVAYHFWVQHPYDVQGVDSRTRRVPAGRVRHLFWPRRPSQTQGVTWFATILQTLRDLNQFVSDEMTASGIGAKFTVAIKRAVGAGSGLGFIGDGSTTSDVDADGNALEELGAGIIADLGKDDEVEQIESKRPSSQAEPWIKLILESMANGIGMTYLGLTGDVSKATFSSARFTRLLDKTFWRSLQRRFAWAVVMPMRRAVIRQLVAFGRLQAVSPTLFAAQPNRWLATRLLPKGWEEIQVEAEVAAAIRRVQGGFSTLQIENAAFGRNWRRVARQRAREIAYTRDVLELDLAVDYPGQVSDAARGQSGANPAQAGQPEAGQPEAGVPPSEEPVEE